MNRRRTVIAAVAAVILLAVAGWLATHRAAASKPAAQADAAPSVGTAVATTGEFAARVTAQGRIGPPAGSSAKVAFPEPGIVRSVDVRVGDSVVAGAPLAELDRAALGVSVRQAQADAAAAAGQYGGGSVPSGAIRSAQAKLVLAQARLSTLQRGGAAAQSDQIGAQQTLRQAQLKVEADRAAVARDETLLHGGVIATKDLLAAQNQLASDLADERAAQAKAGAADIGYAASLKAARADEIAAENDLRNAQAQATVFGAQSDSAAAKLSAARIAYDQGVLRAPAAGVVLAILKHPGEAVDATTPVVEIGPGAADAITLTVPADAARRVRVGDPVQLTLPQSGQHAGGRVTAVVPAVDPATQSATVAVSGAPAGAVPGDAVSASIVVDHLFGVLVPSSAIVEDPQTGKTIVFARKSDGSFASRAVTVRASDDRTAVVAGGLRAGERIATQGSYQLLAPPGG